jgi:23S rRNA (uracil1939-C5)-methyltransferase
MINKQIPLTIDHLSNLAQGVALIEDKRVYIPNTAKGDEIIAQIISSHRDTYQGKLIKIITPSKDRQEPPCQHYQKCGGCSLQHLNEKSYYDFKFSILKQILEKLNLPKQPITNLIKIGEHKRRRVEFNIKKAKDKITIGFFEKGTNNITNLETCLITDPKIFSLLAPFRELIKTLKKPGNLKKLNLTHLDDGIDLIIKTDQFINNSDKAKLINFSRENKIIRLSEKNEFNQLNEIYSQNPQITLGEIKANFPTGAFLQATKEAQTEITKIIIENLDSKTKNIADLFCGIGSYTLAIEKHLNSIKAYELDQDMITSVTNTTRSQKLEHKITAHKKNLFTNPLSENELSNFDCIIINPPRLGAKTQIEKIAQSKVKKIIMISCNPTTFQRDTKKLIENNYQLTKATAIDQFYLNHYLEIVAIFERN